jgi:hypothetical protein
LISNTTTLLADFLKRLSGLAKTKFCLSFANPVGFFLTTSSDGEKGRASKSDDVVKKKPTGLAKDKQNFVLAKPDNRFKKSANNVVVFEIKKLILDALEQL